MEQNAYTLDASSFMIPIERSARYGAVCYGIPVGFIWTVGRKTQNERWQLHVIV